MKRGSVRDGKKPSDLQKEQESVYKDCEVNYKAFNNITKVDGSAH